MKRIGLGILTVGITLCTGTLVYAFEAPQEQAPQRPDKEEIFSSLDADGDGLISLEEFKNRKEIREQEMFKTLDTDSDGVISIEEFKEHKPPHKGKKAENKEFDATTIFSQMDTDNNGKLTIEEFEVRKPRKGKQQGCKNGEQEGKDNKPNPEDFFTKLDTNNNGEVTLKEFEDGKPQDKDNEVPEIDPKVLFTELDTDKNSVLTLEELKAKRTRKKMTIEGVFSRIDSDGDGYISKEEFKMHEPERHKKGHRPPPRDRRNR